MKKMFKNLTLSQKTVLYFKSIGLVEVECQSNKYTALYRPDSYYYMVGKNGSVRRNKTLTLAGSRSVAHVIKDKVKSWSMYQNQKAWIELT